MIEKARLFNNAFLNGILRVPWLIIRSTWTMWVSYLSFSDFNDLKKKEMEDRNETFSNISLSLNASEVSEYYYSENYDSELFYLYSGCEAPANFTQVIKNTRLGLGILN